MKKSLILFGTFLLAALSTTAQAQNYYVCDNGNDSNNGQSEAAPFKTYDKAMDTFKKMNAGDSILFCRGGTFNGSSSAWIWNNRCSADKPCTIADYGDSSKPMPKIVATQNDAISFINPGNGSPDGGYILKNLMLLGSGVGETGVRLLNEVNDLLIENMHIEGFRLGVYYSGANKPYENGGNGINERIVLKNSTIINNVRSGFFGSCSDCLFENNVFENNGSQATFDHNFYLASTEAGPSENVIFRNNSLYRSAVVNGKCTGTSWVAHGILKNITVENNTVKEDPNGANNGCWGITFTPGYGYEESFTNIIIRNNRVQNLALGIGCSSCKDVIIEGNIIIDEGDVMASGIEVPIGGENSLKSSNVNIRNNKVAANRNEARGISIGGMNPFVVNGNEVSMKSENSLCFRRTDANANTDISSNSCKTHDKVSVIDDTTTQPEVELVEDNNTPPYQEEEPPVQADSGNDSSPNQEQPEPVDVAENEVPTQEEPATQQPGDNNNDAGDNNQNDNVADSGDSTTSPDTQTGGIVRPGLDNVTQIPTTSSTAGNTTPESEATVERPTSSNTTQRAPSRSSNVVTWKNVLQAYREDLSTVDISECRVVARGRCLMR